MKSEVEEFESDLSDVRQALQTGFGYTDSGSGNIKAIGESVRFFNRLQQDDALSEREKQYVQTWIDRSKDCLIRPFESGRTLNLAYYSGDRGRDRWGELTKVLASLLSLEAIRGVDSPLSLQDTTWEYVEEGFDHICKETEETLQQFQDSHSTGDVYFVLLNGIEVLDGIKASDDITGYQRKLHTILEKFEDDFRDEIASKKGLHIYSFDLYHRNLIAVDLNEPEYTGDAYHALGRLRRGVRIEPSSIELKRRSPHLSGIAKAWARAKCGEPSGIVPFYLPLDMEEVYRRVWGDPNDIESQSVGGSARKKVLAMKDKDVKENLYEILKGNKHLTTASRSSLKKEVEKAHSGAEISDFDIEIEMDEERISVSMPIKSPAEAGNKNVDKLSEENINQIVRPASRFRTERVAVFPILLSGMTSYSNETLKSWRSNFDFPIVTIDLDEFSKILSFHDQI